MVRFYQNAFDEMPCKMESTENPRSFEKDPTQPHINAVTLFLALFHHLLGFFLTLVVSPKKIRIKTKVFLYAYLSERWGAGVEYH